jgi:inosine-uridine nucleoside N-ribohydrolase
VRATKDVFVDIETHGELTRGYSAIDELGITGKEPNCVLVTDFDTQGFLELFLGVLQS